MLFVLVALTGVLAKGIAECLYCKKMDTTQGVLYLYSYCKENKTCTADSWTYLNKYCKKGWTEGYLLDVDSDCFATKKKEKTL